MLQKCLLEVKKKREKGKINILIVILSPRGQLDLFTEALSSFHF